MEGKCIFGYQRTDLTIVKANFPENILVNVNNGSVTPVKGGHALYLDFVILAQILPVADPPPDLNLDTHKFQDNEVLLYTPLYNTENGLYRGLAKKSGGDANETFFSYGFHKKRSKVLYCANKQPIAKHVSMQCLQKAYSVFDESKPTKFRFLYSGS